MDINRKRMMNSKEDGSRLQPLNRKADLAEKLSQRTVYSDVFLGLVYVLLSWKQTDVDNNS